MLGPDRPVPSAWLAPLACALTHLHMQGGYTVSIGLSVAAFGVTCRFLLYSAAAPQAWLHFLGCGLVGILTAYAFVWIAQYYTDYKYRPVRLVAEASTTGHGTNIIAGGPAGVCAWQQCECELGPGMPWVQRTWAGAGCRSPVRPPGPA